MTLTTAAITYYAIATPLLILMCKMMYVGGKDKSRGLNRPSYEEALATAHNNLPANMSDNDKYTGRLGSHKH